MEEIRPHIEAQTSHPELQRFWDKFTNQYILRPDTPAQRAHAHHTMLAGNGLMREGCTSEGLHQLNNLILDPTASTVSLLMAADTIGRILRSDADHPMRGSLEEILTHMASVVSHEDYLGDPSNFDRRQAHRLITMASVYHALGSQTPSSDASEYHVANSLYLASAATFLEDLPLHMDLPELTSVSNESDEDLETGTGFPDSQMVLSRGRLADWIKFERACIWGIPIDGEFVRRLPGAIVCLETERKVSRLETSGLVRSRSKYNYIRIPSLTPVSPIFEDIYQNLEYWNDEGVLDAHALSSLSYFIARRALRKVQNFQPEGQSRNSTLANEYNQKGYPVLVEHYVLQCLKKLVLPVLHAPARISDEEMRNDHIRTFPGILQTAALECHDETGVMHDRDPLLRQLKASAELILLRYDSPTQSYTLRTPEEIDRLFVRQTLAELSFPDLLTFATKFIQNPTMKDLSTLTPEDSTTIEGLLGHVRGYISTQSSLSREELINAEKTLRTFLEPVLELRFRTVRDKGKAQEYP